MLRIVFLDIDGVLAVKRPAVTFQPFAGPSRSGHRPMRRFAVSRLVPACIESLNRLTTQSGAQLVVSSSWRLRGDVRPVLKSNGVVGTFHEDWHTDADGPERSDEIVRWLDKHAWPPFVVLDDWPPNAAGLIADYVVLTDYTVGLSDHDVDLALRLFGDPIQRLARELLA